MVLLGVAGGALLVLAERAQAAHAQTPDPPAAPASPSVPAPDLPPVTTPPPTTPPAPAPPPVPEPPPPPAPPTVPLPTSTAPTTPALPGVPSGTLPEVPAPGLPVVPSALQPAAVPVAPGVPGIDAGRTVGAVGNGGALPDVPEVSPTEAAFPDLSELPDPAIPLNGVLDLSAAPAPAAPVPTDALDRAPSVPVAQPAPSHVELAETGELLQGSDFGFAPARAPPTDPPGSPHPSPGGASPHPTRADPAAYLSPGADQAARRAGLLAEARVYASTLLRDPLLRPD